MATYNGGKYIKEQLESILSQLNQEDEIIISDDMSTDDTLEIARSFNDSRIKIFSNEGPHGPINNFENALNISSGDYIFLADQDDIWLKGRVNQMMAILLSGKYECVICNRNIIDKYGNIVKTNIIKKDFTKFSFMRVLLHNPYIGCCMAFTRKHLNVVIPFAKDIAMHDIWIGLIAHRLHTVKFIEVPYVLYRRHGENTTTDKRYPIIYRIKYRIKFIKEIRRRLKERQL